MSSAEDQLVLPRTAVPIKVGDQVRMKRGLPASGLFRGEIGMVILVDADAMVMFSGKLVRLSLENLVRTEIR